MSALSAIIPIPNGTPPLELPKGYTSKPLKGADGHLRGYLCTYPGADGKPRSRTIAWAANGDASKAAWAWVEVPPEAGAVADTSGSQDDDYQDRHADAQPERHAEPEHEHPEAPPPFPFTLLGYDHEIYYYIGHGKQQITALKASQHTASNLYQLAPQSFWARHWPSKRGFDSDQASADLMELQHKRGVYDPTRQCGRGVWWDRAEKKTVVHLGDALIINGERIGLHEHNSRQIYECAVPLPYADKWLSNVEAKKLVSVCESLTWTNPTYGRLLAGWIVCAFLSGGLRWRPSIWIQGPFQSGKSTVFDHIISRALGGMAKKYVGGVTEAALRAMLRVDAMPIIIDDMDSGTARGRENVAAILDLMKVFSGEGGGVIAKASQTGGAPVITNLSCCYAFSSVLMNCDDSAVKSRIAVLNMVPRPFAEGQLDELHANIDAALPPEFSPALFARCVHLLPIIRANAETFASAVASQTGQRRSGDLYGHLFAGAYSLFSDKLATTDEAMEYIGKREAVVSLMAEAKQAIAENSEGERCLSHLLEQVVTDTLDGRMWRGSIYDLVRMAKGPDLNSSAHAEYLLRRNGVIVKGENFYVANDHTALRQFYHGSSWAIGWGAILKTIKTASFSEAMSFNGRKTRATRLPLALLGPHVDEPASG